MNMIGEVNCIIPKGNVCSALNITANSAEKKRIRKKNPKTQIKQKTSKLQKQL